jgi:hypothetical protein
MERTAEMRYMIRDVFQCKRGQVPVIVDDLRTIIEVMKGQEITDHHVYVDIAEQMDTVFHQYEVDSLDQYFAWERGLYVDPAPETRQLVNHYNENTVAGRREIYEVVL